nr:McmE [Thermoactinomyces sp.]
MRKAKIVLVADVMTNEKFAGKSLADAINAHSISSDLREYSQGIRCHYESERVREGVIRIRYTSELIDLTHSISIVHRYSFPLFHESREKGFILTPENPVATSEILIAIGDYKQNYFNITVHDSSHYMMHCDVLIYNHKGELKPYHLPDEQFICPLQVEESLVTEEMNEEGVPVLRTKVVCSNVKEKQKILVGYNSTGITTEETHYITPEKPVILSEVPLRENPQLIPGDFLIGMTDDRNRLLVNALARCEVIYS